MTLCPGSNQVAGARENGDRVCRICNEALPDGVQRDENFQVWMPEHPWPLTLCEGYLAEPVRVGDDLSCPVCGGIKKAKIKTTWLVVDGTLRVPPHVPKATAGKTRSVARERYRGFRQDLEAALEGLRREVPGDWKVTQPVGNTWVLWLGEVQVCRWTSRARAVGGVQGVAAGLSFDTSG